MSLTIQQQKDYPSSTAPHNKPPYKQNQIQQMSPIANKFIRRNVITPSKAIKNIDITTPNKNHKLIRIIRPQMQRENRHINRIKSDGNLGPKIYGIQNYPQQNKVVIKLPVRRISNNQIVPANFQSGINKKNYAIRTNERPYFGNCDLKINSNMKMGISFAKNNTHFLSDNNLELTGRKGESETFETEELEVYKVILK